MAKAKPIKPKVDIEECPIGTPESLLVLFPVYLKDGSMDYAASEKSSFAIKKVAKKEKA